MTFDSLNLKPEVLGAIARLGFEKPTDIQGKVIPEFLAGKDLLGQSATGSGKTAAFLLPIIDKLIEHKGRALILTPTRELALQINEVLHSILKQTIKLKSVLLVGGASIVIQLKHLKQKPEIMIATPGRLIDHLDRRSIYLKSLHTLVLDEADRMLDMGFLPQIEEIAKHIPEERQTALFSATFDDEVKKIASIFLNNPVEISSDEIKEENAIPSTITQSIVKTQIVHKKGVLLDELQKRKGTTIVFVKTKHKTEELAKFLIARGFPATRIHGDRSLNQRKEAIQHIKTKKASILVATDVAARGLDIRNIKNVINFDIPTNPEDYIHRIGRTGRAGDTGEALSFITPEDTKAWNAIERMIVGKTSAQKKNPVKAKATIATQKPQKKRRAPARKRFSSFYND